MYYKIEEGTETFLRLEKVWDKIMSCNKQALSLVVELGFEKFGGGHGLIAGGISCVKSNTKPEGFKIVGKKWQDLYYPKANNKSVLSQFRKLPVVTYSEYNEVIGFEDQYQGMSHYASYVCSKVANRYLIEVYFECDYIPKDDMVEIVASEYKSLGEIDK